jgi:hypothetical protein
MIYRGVFASVFAIASVFILAALPVRAMAGSFDQSVALVEQEDDSISTTFQSNCDNTCSNIVFGSQVFVTSATAPLGTLEIFTANFQTDSRNPDTNDCYAAISDQDTGQFLARSDNGFTGFGCAGDLVFDFTGSEPLLHAGTHYRWDFIFGSQNHSVLAFLGSPSDTVGGAFSKFPVVNAKFIALASIPDPLSSSLRQLRNDGVTDIASGQTIQEPATQFSASFSSSQFSFPITLQLQIEVRPMAIPFSEVFDDGIVTSISGSTGTQIAVSRINADGLWHWRARFVDSQGNVSRWVEFGNKNNADFIVQTAPPITDPTILAEQDDGSLTTHTASNCDNTCKNVPIGHQVFTPLRSGKLSSIEIFTSNFNTQSLNPFTNFCTMQLLDEATGAPIAQADNVLSGFSCNGDLVFTFINTSPTVQTGMHYRWNFYWGAQNRNTLDILGSSNNIVGGIFTPFGPVVNAKFIVKGVANDHEPIVIVPGIMGSRLNRASDGVEVWPNGNKMANPLTPSDSYLDDLKLDTSANQIKQINTGDVIRSETVVLENVFYKKLIDEFNKNGYRENQNLFVVPYDWRMDINSQVTALDAKIQSAISTSPNGKINIIAHSMGGLLVKKYLSNVSSASTFLDKLILAGVPEIGAPRSFNALNYGDDFGMNFIGLFGLNTQEEKSIAQNMPAVYQLLPSRKYFQSTGGYVHDFRNGGNTFLNFDQTANFMANNSDSDENRNASLLEAADTFHQDLDSLPVNASSVYNIVGCLKPTISGFNIQDNGVVDLERTTGDGTVPAISPMDLANNFNNYFILGDETGIDHTGLIKDFRPLELIKNIIDDAASSATLPDGISTSLADCLTPHIEHLANETTVEFSTHSPVELHVYDSQNRHTGPRPNGDIELGIPGSEYEKIGENSFILVPASDIYKVISQGLSSGSFMLKVKGYVGASIDAQATYISVPLQSKDTKAELSFSNFEGDMGLNLDNDGDGTPDTIIQPNAILSALSSADITPPDVTMPSIPSQVLQFSTVTLLFNATDTESGVALVNATLNGAPVSSGQVVNLSQPGSNIFHIEAIDNAGNPRVEEVNFNVLAQAISVPSTAIFKIQPNPNNNSGETNRTVSLNKMSNDWTRFNPAWNCANETNMLYFTIKCLASAWQTVRPPIAFAETPQNIMHYYRNTMQGGIANNIIPNLTGSRNYGWSLTKNKETMVGFIDIASGGVNLSPKLTNADGP